MSYMIDFPPHCLPADIRSPPYVIFGIQGEDVSSELPSNIPLTMVLHFAPKMKTWVFPLPTRLTPFVWRLVLWKPFVGINILEPISAAALLFIVNRMLQTAGLAWQKDNFYSYPGIVFSVDVLKAWRVLELPPSGIQSLETHLLSRCMMGPPVMLKDIQGLWSAFPVTSPILREMAHNFIRAHVNFEYALEETNAIKNWIRGTKERRDFFRQFENQYKDYSEGRTILAKTTEGGSTTALASSKREAVGLSAAAPVAVKVSEIIERNRTRRVTPQERKAREKRDAEELKNRLRRLKSDDTIRTVIYDPRPTPLAEEHSTSGKQPSEEST